MKRLNPIALIAIVLGGYLVFTNLGGLFQNTSKPEPVSSTTDDQRVLTILSGSENMSLEPVVTKYCQSKRWTCVMDYRGSVDIMLALRERQTGFDAVWPAHSRWIDLGDDLRRVKHTASIFKSPIILGIQKGTFDGLGWDPHNVTMADITQAVEQQRLSYLMTSATQSNSGFSAYIAMLTNLSETDVLTASSLEEQSLQDQVKTILSGVDRSAGSSGWLAELYTSTAAEGHVFPAMWNYEALLIETNQELERQRLDPLTFIYPSDGVAIADSPLGFIENEPENAKKREELFLGLQKHLLSDRVQRSLTDLGRREAFGARVTKPKKKVWKAAWNIDLDRSLPAIEFPSPSVTQASLKLYQTALRKPSAIAFCLDYSGSMAEGNGERDLERALVSLFDERSSTRYLLESTTSDRFFMMPFNSSVLETKTAQGQAQGLEVARKLTRENSPGGGTDIYACASEAIAQLKNLEALEDFSAGVILMTDGLSEDRYRAFRRFYQRNDLRIPVYGITFGDAERRQLDDMAKLSAARVFDGRTDLIRAFRQARGYN